MAVTHDPLNDVHMEFLNGLPTEVTVHDQLQGPRGQAIAFLQGLGLIRGKMVHISADPGKSVMRYERTEKPLP